MPSLSIDKALNIPFLVIGIVITVAMVVAMFPTLNDQLYTLSNTNSNNTLIQAIKPVLPYLTGVVLLMFILVPIFYALKRLGVI